MAQEFMDVICQLRDGLVDKGRTEVWISGDTLHRDFLLSCDSWASPVDESCLLLKNMQFWHASRLLAIMRLK